MSLHTTPLSNPLTRSHDMIHITKCVNCSKPLLNNTAVNYIFKLQQKDQLVSKEGEPFGSCTSCATIIGKLYELHAELEELNDLESVIGKFISAQYQSLTTKVYQFVSSKIPLKPGPPVPIDYTTTAPVASTDSVVSDWEDDAEDVQSVSSRSMSPRTTVTEPSVSEMNRMECAEVPESRPVVVWTLSTVESKQEQMESSKASRRAAAARKTRRRPRSPQSSFSDDLDELPEITSDTHDISETDSEPQRRSKSRQVSKGKTKQENAEMLRLKRCAKDRARQSSRPTFTHPPCPHCGKVFVNKKRNYLEHHVNLIHKLHSKFPCDMCGKPFHCQLHKVEHERTHMNAVERSELEAIEGKLTFLCSECGKVLLSERSLRLHYEKCHGNPEARRTACSEPGCDFTCLTARTMRRHHAQMHDPNTVPRFECKQCGQLFKVHTDRKEHVMLECEVSNRPFVCDQSPCQRRFKIKKDLLTHVHGFHKLSLEAARESVYPDLDPAPQSVSRPRKRTATNPAS